MITAKKTTYKVDGCNEPCFEVTDGYTMVRIAKMYHLVGKNTIIITEYIDGEYNSSEEWTGDFDSMTKAKAIQVAKSYSAYIEK